MKLFWSSSCTTVNEPDTCCPECKKLAKNSKTWVQLSEKTILSDSSHTSTLPKALLALAAVKSQLATALSKTRNKKHPSIEEILKKFLTDESTSDCMLARNMKHVAYLLGGGIYVLLF